MLGTALEFGEALSFLTASLSFRTSLGSKVYPPITFFSTSGSLMMRSEKDHLAFGIFMRPPHQQVSQSAPRGEWRDKESSSSPLRTWGTDLGSGLAHQGSMLPALSSFTSRKKEQCVPAGNLENVVSVRHSTIRQRRNSCNASSNPKFVTEGNRLSSFEVEYALLEHALRKDYFGTQTADVDELRAGKSITYPLLEPDFYFGDILGDNGVSPLSLGNIVKSDENTQENAEISESGKALPSEVQRSIVPSQGARMNNFSISRSEDSEDAETDLSNALASLVDSRGPTRDQPMPIDRLSCKEEPAVSQKPYLGCISGGQYNIEGLIGEAHFAHSSRAEGNVSSNGETFLQPNVNNEEVLSATVSIAGDAVGNKEHQHMSSSERNHKDLNTIIHSPVSDSSMTRPGIRSHPDLYENLSADLRQKVDELRGKITSMPRRKLRESLAQGVTIDDVEPLMCVNRDELAGMLGLGVTTWKMFVHHTLGIPRWPARALKSQQVKERKLLQKKLEAEHRGDYELVHRVQRDLLRLTQAHLRRRRNLRSDANLRTGDLSIRKKERS